jgi:phospholipase/lecithinase/hemolysin
LAITAAGAEGVMAYTGVHVFGDSLVDAGNALKLAQWYGTLTLSDLPDGAPSEDRGYFKGRFSDGYTFADLVSNKYIGVATKPVFPYFYEDPWLGVKIAPLASDPSGNNLNFAYGGAQIRQGDEVVPDLDGQTDAFRHAVDGDADSGALYLITMGGNDVRSLVPSDSASATLAEASATLQSAANRFNEEVLQLIDIGVTNIVVTGVPDVGMIPRYDVDHNKQLTGVELQRSQTATQYSALLDGMLQQQVALLRAAHPGATITYVSLTDATEENLAFLETLYSRPIDPLADQDMLFVDEIHPNAQVHALLAAAIFDTINKTTGNNLLPLTAPDYSAGGTVAVKGEVDKVVVSLIAGTTYTFEMLGISSANGVLADPTLRVLGPSGALVGSNDDGGLGLDARITFTAAATGEYALELAGVGITTGTYEFAASGNAPGNNVYIVKNAGAVILEQAGEGTDTVKASVSYALGAGAAVETLRTANDKGKTAINLTGNEFDQTIVGNLGANRIDGKGGLDSLFGKAGADTFIFSTAPGPGNVDTIQDYNALHDTIALDDAIYDGTVGALAAGAFAIGSAASQLDDRVIYDPVLHKLYYDADGSGAGAAVHFATLYGPNLNLSAGDFVFV